VTAGYETQTTAERIDIEKPTPAHYAAEHKRLRKQVARAIERGGVLCWLCKEWIRPGEPWDLGHSDAPGAKALGIYAGPEHRACSRTAGGWKRQGVIGMPPPRRSTPPAKALEFFSRRRSDCGTT
jgi:hypothetical protein